MSDEYTLSPGGVLVPVVSEPSVFHVVAHLRNVETGETGIYEDDWDYREGEGHTALYMWCDGNFSCDCNRSRFLYGYDEEKVMPCSDGRIVIDLLTIKETGHVLMRDNEAVMS